MRNELSFAAPTKAQWLQRIEKELRGKDSDVLNWFITADWKLNPMYTSEVERIAVPHSGSNNWLIKENIPVIDAGKANKVAIKALEDGATALSFELQASFSDYDSLLKDIRLDWIHTYFVCNDPLHCSDGLVNYVNASGQQAKNLKGGVLSVEFDASTAKSISDNLSDFKNCRVELKAEQDTIHTLAHLLRTAADRVDQMTDAGFSYEDAVSQLIVNIPLNTNFLMSVAMLRAFRLLWANVNAAYENSPSIMPFVQASIEVSALTEDPYENMIRIPIIALSAACGGCNLLDLPAADAKADESLNYTAKLSRDVHHILQLESHLNDVSDPSAGSYYIDSLTKELAEKAWNVFVKL